MSLKWISANHLSVSLLSISSVPESESVVAQSCLTAGNPTDCSPPGSSVHGILQARVLEWVAIPFSKGSSHPRDGTWASCTAGRFFTAWATKEAWFCHITKPLKKKKKKIALIYEYTIIFLGKDQRGKNGSTCILTKENRSLWSQS